MFMYIRIVAMCTITGLLLACVFMTPAGAAAGAVKGFLVGGLIAWGEWKSRHEKKALRI